VRADNAADLERVRTTLARTLEFTKGRYAAERKAYDELLGGIYTYYYTLSPLAAGSWHATQVGQADDGMVAVCRHLVAVTPAHRRVWVAFWQAARSVRELAEDLTSRAQSVGAEHIAREAVARQAPRASAGSRALPCAGERGQPS